MEVYRLLGDELTYELAGRGLPIGGTVQEKRVALSEALREERLGITSFSWCRTMDTQTEFNICNQKLVSLGNDVTNFNTNNKRNEFKRLSSRLIHIQGRLERLRMENEQQEEVRCGLLYRCMELLDSVRRLYENLPDIPGEGEIYEEENVSLLDRPNSPHQPIIDEMNPLIPGLVSPNRHSQQAVPVSTASSHIPPIQHPPTPAPRLSHPTPRGSSVRFEPEFMSSSYPRVAQSTFPTFSSTNLGYNRVRGRTFIKDSDEIPTNFTFSQPTYNVIRTEGIPGLTAAHLSSTLKGDSGESPQNFRFPDVNRWGVKFDGDRSVTSFLERIEELRVSRGVSKEQLLRSAPELFTSDALSWFRMNHFTTWDELVRGLKESFLPFDYENLLWDEIRKRTQGCKERVVCFVAAMENLFNKLDVKPAEEARLKIIRRNLLPTIQTHLALCPISSISELIRMGRTIEESNQVAQRFIPPPTNFKQLLEPDLAYRKPTSGNSSATLTSAVSNRNNSTLDDTPKSVDGPTHSTTPSCWNCNSSGHRFRQCDKPRQKFCYKCGKKNVVASSCPSCISKNVAPKRQ